MKIVHFECGLGNQMTCYANYLLVRHNNPSDEVYMENLVYKIDRKNIGINQWNGFEIGKIFGIQFIDVCALVNDTNLLLRDMESEYSTNRGQNNSFSAINALKNNGLSFDVAGNVYKGEREQSITGKLKFCLSTFVAKPGSNWFSYKFKRLIYKISKKLRNPNVHIYDHREGDWYYPLSFEVMKNISMLEPIKEQIVESFSFPKILDDQNAEAEKLICKTESVAIHARRSDFLQYNSDCYKYGYFKKAVRYIKNHVKNPFFFIFSEDSKWCKENLQTLGLSEDDNIYFVDWNSGENSYRDMQLMSECKHNIITKSSFGWWAAYLNKNKNKIIISQLSEYYSKIYY